MSQKETPDRFGQATRSRGLLKAINAGYTPAGAGAVAGMSRAPSPEHAVARLPERPTVNLTVNVSVLKNENPDVVGNAVGRGVKRALAGVKL